MQYAPSAPDTAYGRAADEKALLHVGLRKNVEIGCEQESGVVLGGCRKVIKKCVFAGGVLSSVLCQQEVFA